MAKRKRVYYRTFNGRPVRKATVFERLILMFVNLRRVD